MCLSESQLKSGPEFSQNTTSKFNFLDPDTLTQTFCLICLELGCGLEVTNRLASGHSGTLRMSRSCLTVNGALEHVGYCPFTWFSVDSLFATRLGLPVQCSTPRTSYSWVIGSTPKAERTCITVSPWLVAAPPSTDPPLILMIFRMLYKLFSCSKNMMLAQIVNE